MKPISSIIFFLLLVSSIQGQIPISTYNIINKVPIASSNSADGWFDPEAPYSSSTTYSLFYGKVNGTTNGISRSVESFIIGPDTYTAVPSSPGKPFDTLIIKRIDNANATGRRVTSLFETGSFNGGSNELYLQPTYAETMEGLINTQNINSGSDNTFDNTGSTNNNIERIDMIFKTGISATSLADLDKVGVLINERGGNDDFTIAAITGIDASNNVTSYGPLITINASSWGTVGPSISTVVMAKEELDLFLRPKQDISPQTISGVFVRLSTLGVSPGSYIKGISLFPGDVGTDLIGLSDAILTTGGSNGGLDLMSGSGFYRDINTMVILPLNFSEFSAQLVHNNAIQLNWISQADKFQNGKFKIERSANGNSWIELGEVIEKNYSPAHEEYEFIDVNPLPGDNFYRIKHIDFKETPSLTRTIRINNINVIDKIEMSHPAGSNYLLINTGNFEGKFIIRIISMNGRIVSNQKVNNGKHTTFQYKLKRNVGTSFIVNIINKGKPVLKEVVIR